MQHGLGGDHPREDETRPLVSPITIIWGIPISHAEHILYHREDDVWSEELSAPSVVRLGRRERPGTRCGVS
jgi:hypothetical protein